jgi:hypothetical protein
MLRNDAYWFSRLGVDMGADNTARILDVRHHLLLPANERRWPARLPNGRDPALGRALTAYHWVCREALAADRGPAHPQGRHAARSQAATAIWCRTSTMARAYGRWDRLSARR